MCGPHCPIGQSYKTYDSSVCFFTLLWHNTLVRPVVYFLGDGESFNFKSLQQKESESLSLLVLLQATCNAVVPLKAPMSCLYTSGAPILFSFTCVCNHVCFPMGSY